jgi:hypothetical protein
MTANQMQKEAHVSSFGHGVRASWTSNIPQNVKTVFKKFLQINNKAYVTPMNAICNLITFHNE